MKFFDGDLKHAISKRKTFVSAFVVFVEAKDEESTRFRRLLDEERTIPTKEYVAFRISPSSDSYKHFIAIYRDVPVPSLFIIGTDGQPIRILSTCEPPDEFYSAIRQALDVHKAESLAHRRIENNLVQILLKLPRGETAVVEFDESARLREVHTFVRESLQVKTAFELFTPYPRKLFSEDDGEKTLAELELSPTSTLLVVSADNMTSWRPQFVSNGMNRVMFGCNRIFRSVTDWITVNLTVSRGLPEH
ncbi:hypothetical protein RUM43_014585 [Polyplax serrata]|uniref:UBX domain-containing protein 4 n=1 Tax=Polyplax serrata TaxID=468196 RepID=A0AAN8P491_POLSC